MQEAGKFFVVFGCVCIAIGTMLWLGIARGWLGRLPGDIHIAGEKYCFHFPVATCVLISIVLSAILWLLRR